MTTARLITGDVREVLPTLDACSVDAIVTDPPAGISFMGKHWDGDRGGRSEWVAWMTEVMGECLRILKPGGHALVWALPRTSHWTGMALEDAGFELRDQIMHLFGSGFPKSLDVSKAIDKASGADREIVGTWQPTGTARIKGNGNSGHGYDHGELRDSLPITAPATPEAAQWDGWGTALKPSYEIWWLCRKPLSESSIAANVLRWSTGALNIDACRIGSDTITTHSRGTNTAFPKRPGETRVEQSGGVQRQDGIDPTPRQGRFPSHLLLSHSLFCVPLGTKRVKGSNGVRGSDDGNTMYGGGRGLNRPSTGQEVGYADPDGYETVEAWDCDDSCPVAMLDAQSGHTAGKTIRTPMSPNRRNSQYGGHFHGQDEVESGYPDAGGASRFFYVAKASRSERDAGLDDLPLMSVHPPEPNGRVWDIPGSHSTPRRNVHPTVKPLALMRYLCRLITPPGGLILDPFTGSGSTGVAALQEGFRFVGVEREPEYVEIAQRRIEATA